MLRLKLQGALSQMDFLQSSVGQELMQSLEREATDALTDSTTQLSGLSQTLKVSMQPIRTTCTVSRIFYLGYCKVRM